MKKHGALLAGLAIFCAGLAHGALSNNENPPAINPPPTANPPAVELPGMPSSNPIDYKVTPPASSDDTIPPPAYVDLACPCPDGFDHTKLDADAVVKELKDLQNWVDDTLASLQGIPLEYGNPEDDAKLKIIFAKYEAACARTLCLRAMIKPGALWYRYLCSTYPGTADQLKALIDSINGLLNSTQKGLSDMFQYLYPSPPVGDPTHEIPVRG